MDKGKKVVLIPFKLCHKLLIWCMMSQFVVIKDQQHQHGRQLCTEKILKKMKITLNLFILTTAVKWMEGLSVLWAANIQDQLCEVQVMDFGNDQWDNVTNAYLKLRIFMVLCFISSWQSTNLASWKCTFWKWLDIIRVIHGSIQLTLFTTIQSVSRNKVSWGKLSPGYIKNEISILYFSTGFPSATSVLSTAVCNLLVFTNCRTETIQSISQWIREKSICSCILIID